MNEEGLRDIIKSKLQNLSKEQLIDALVDVCMATLAFMYVNDIHNIRCTNIANEINYVQHVNSGFATLQQTLGEITKMQ